MKRILSVCLIAVILATFCGFTICRKVTIKIEGKEAFEKDYYLSKFALSIRKQELINGGIESLKRLDEGLYKDLVCFAKKERISPQNASVKYDYLKEYPFVFTKEVWGKEVDERKLYYDVLRALYGENEVIKVGYCNLEPKIKEKDLREEYALISTFSTDYSFSGENRKRNVELAAKKLDNLVISSGEEFSFNQKIGKRSEENGFLNAPIIVDGKYVNGVGGGICQVSSTLYNAFLLAGLTVTEARRHTLPVSYVEPSFDAMVSEWSDLKATNQSESPIYLKVSAKKGKIEVRIYGKKQEYSVVRKSVVTEVLPYETIIIKSGEEKKGKNGLKSYAKLIYYKDGKIIGEKVVRRDEYLPQNEIALEKPDEEIC